MKLAMGAPEPLTPADVLDSFDCGEAALDDWLKRRALSNQLSGASRTFVVSDTSRRVFGYHALAAGAVSHELATASVRRNMPDPVPVLVLARLAIDRQAQGLKLGAALLQDALNRAIAVSQNAGISALLVHALNGRARSFYQHYGFQPSTVHSMTLMLKLSGGQLRQVV